ncbi:uncharacterized protein LOC132935986 [Metopolophium dirhodum]|uniref:uncharacterized protein LOC132935986 n=1 Tax=Metopolophium dirhodum TaxID=44670 RepID=UPI00299014E2|nr:uncharacterized protein LOC132935986 [Metopolophium dirhodum]XP_060858618.1 uncharacterized protein LOC132935986 [Metopolophium dirhodum]
MNSEVCGNSIKDTKQTGPELISHRSTTQSNDMQVDNNTCLPIEQNRLREEQHIENAVANNLVPPKPSCKQTNDDMPRIQTKRFKKEIPADQFIANDNIQTVIKSVVEPVTTTTKEPEPQCAIPEFETNTSEDNGFNEFIFTISKMIELPSVFWESVYVKDEKETSFYQTDGDQTLIAKKVCFFNSPVPIITIYDKVYKFNVPILAKNRLKLLLDIINNVEKSFGMDEKFIDFFQESYAELEDQLRTSGKIPTQREIISYYSKHVKTLPKPFRIITNMK